MRTETMHATRIGRSRSQGRSSECQSNPPSAIALLIAPARAHRPAVGDRSSCETHENHELHLLILLWEPPSDVPENGHRPRLLVGASVGACSRGDSRGGSHRSSTAATSSTLSLFEKTMWNKPEFTEMRFGFEVTMYIANR